MSSKPAGKATKKKLRVEDQVDLDENEPLLSQITGGMPSWLASLMLHLAAILALALWTLPLTSREPTALSSAEVDTEIVELNEEILDIEFQTEDTDLEETSELDVEVDLDTEIEIESLESSEAMTFEDTSLDLVDFSADIGMMEATPSSGSGMGVEGLSGRSAAGRRRMVRKAGGSRESEQAVDAALLWLARHQLPDGSWSFDHRYGECNGQCSHPGEKAKLRAGATGLALLPFLGAGNTHREGKYHDIVERGGAALVQMLKMTPDGATVIDKDVKGGPWMYSHGIASMALSEAFAMTGDETLRAPAQSLLAFTCNAQDPKGGGWRYQPRQKGDTSVMGWHVGALKSGYMASLQVPPIVVQRASYYLDTAEVDGGVGYCYNPYSPEPPKYSSTCSSIGLLCRMYMGMDQTNPVLQRGVERLLKYGPSKNNAYYNYYAAQVIYQFTGGEGPLWKKWNDKLRDQLVATQETEGHQAGSWTPPHKSHAQKSGGRLYVTAMSAMTLEVYYRLMPIYQKQATEGFDAQEEEADDKEK
ncbi:prenyltransferase/squalene oxidase repeat-containing protein [Adhaeretor mobilis]|uniref:hypothetical protein n=1 Tax=Adhaeretor mobilis TaxID=1930276 RepID=UPI0011A70C37|nr:hypothetical protein [Adhaeretor mobilis]